MLFYYSLLYYILLYYIISYTILYHILYDILYDIILYYIIYYMIYYMILYYIISHYILYYIISYHIILYYIVLYYIIYVDTYIHMHYPEAHFRTVSLPTPMIFRCRPVPTLSRHSVMVARKSASGGRSRNASENSMGIQRKKGRIPKFAKLETIGNHRKMGDLTKKSWDLMGFIAKLVQITVITRTSDGDIELVRWGYKPTTNITVGAGHKGLGY